MCSITKAEIFCKTFSDATGEKLIDLNGRGRDRRWALKKKRNIKIHDILFQAYDIYLAETGAELMSANTLENIQNCGNDLVFARLADNSRKLAAANFCKYRLCPMCNWRKSLKLFSQIGKITEAILADKPARFMFLTLTVKNCNGEELKDVLDQLNKGFAYLTSPSRTFAPAKKLKESLLGYVKGIEVTYNEKDNSYHPHIHIVLEVKPSYFSKGYIKHAEWRDIWKQAMKLDYDPQVNIKVIKGDEGEAPSPGAIAEVAKYPVKFESILNIKKLETAARAAINLHFGLKNRRLTTFGGDFKEYQKRLKLDDVESGNLIHVEADKDSKAAIVAYELFKYNMKVGGYFHAGTAKAS